MICEMTMADWPRVRSIYEQGIEGNLATFSDAAPEYIIWDQIYAKECRIVYEENGVVCGFAALLPHVGAPAYGGVAEVSVYVDNCYQGRGIGKSLLSELVLRAEAAGYWTLESVITADNAASIRLHQSLGFRLVGMREKISHTPNGVWHDTVIYERRSERVAADGIYSVPKRLTLETLKPALCVCKIGTPVSVPGFYSLTVTEKELSLVCEERYAPRGAVEIEKGFRALRVAGTLNFALIGILSEILAVLSEKAASVFVLSTFDTDYILVKREKWKQALAALRQRGYEVIE